VVATNGSRQEEDEATEKHDGADHHQGFHDEGELPAGGESHKVALLALHIYPAG
jgi:hypothetical protein